MDLRLELAEVSYANRATSEAQQLIGVTLVEWIVHKVIHFLLILFTCCSKCYI